MSTDPRPALDTSRPFATREAAAAGLDPKRLRRLGHSPVLHGVWVGGHVPVDLRTRALGGLLLAGPDAWVRGRTAARLWRGIVPDDDRVHVGLPRGPDPGARRRLRVDQLAVTRRTVPSDLVVRDGVRTTSASRTFVDLAAELSLVDLVVLGDSLVARRTTTPGVVRAAAAVDTSRHGGRARHAAALVRERVDSPKETRLRLLLVLAGLPEPAVDHRIRDDQGRVLRRIDLAYREERVAVEFDGRHHVERQDQWLSDIDRREQLEALGWTFVVVTSAGVHGDAARTVDRVAAALAARGRRVRPHDGWRRYL